MPKHISKENSPLTCSATPTNTLPRHGSANNQLTEQSDLVNRNITYNAAINSCSNSELALSSTSIRDVPCTLQNCDLNTSCSLIRSSSSLSSNGGGIVGSGCYSAPSTMKMNQQNQTSNQSLAQILATNQSTQNLYEQYIDCMSTGAVSQTILPPPLFDTNCSSFNQCYELQSHPGNYCTLSAIEMPKISSSSSSKRLHRTIPKHFTMSSPSSSAILSGEMTQQQQHVMGRSNEIKKPSCQCPVQHVPMTYMQFPTTPTAQQHIQQPLQELQPVQQQPYPQQQQQRHQHSIYMSGSKKHNVIKSTTFPSAMNASSGGKIQTITNSEMMGMVTDMLPPSGHSESTGSHISSGGSHISSGGSGTLRRSHKSSSSGSSSNANSLVMPTTPNKKSIATISVANPVQQSTAGSTPGYYAPKMDLKPPPQQQIHSILKNKNSHSGCHVNVINVTDGAGSEQNPILPPKMYKTSSSGPPTPGGSKQIHTITRPNELTSSSSQFSLLAINSSSQKYQQQLPQYQHQQPTQLRTNIQVSALSRWSELENLFPRCFRIGNIVQYEDAAERFAWL